MTESWQTTIGHYGTMASSACQTKATGYMLFLTRGMVYQSTAEKKSSLNKGRAPVHATRPGMHGGRHPEITLVSCTAPSARAPPSTARRSRPDMGARRTRSGDAQPRSARARNRRGNPGRISISTISSTNFFTIFLSLIWSLPFFATACLVPWPPLHAPSRRQGISRRGLRGRCKSMSLERSAGCAGDANR